MHAPWILAAPFGEAEAGCAAIVRKTRHVPAGGRTPKVLWVLALGAALAGEASGAPYDFTKIAESGGMYAFVSSPRITPAGEVVFLADLSGGGDAIVLGDGASTTHIYDTDTTTTIASIDSLDINGSNRVAFLATLAAGGREIFAGNGGALATIAASTAAGGQFASFGGTTFINDGGMVAWQGIRAFGGVSVSTGVGGPVTTVYGAGDTFGGLPFVNFSNPRINNAGDLVSFAFFGSGNGSALVVGNGGTTTVIASDSTFDPASPFATLIGAPAMNDDGVVVFPAILVSGGRALAVGDGSVPAEILVDTATSVFASFGGPSINNAGQIVFVAALDSGTTALFDGIDPGANNVIGVGDGLDGSEVTGLLTGDINDAGQIAFRAVLADGRNVIVRADPGTTASPIPLLSSVGGLLLGALLAGPMLWASRRQVVSPPAR
jgi:hypothetical protein